MKGFNLRNEFGDKVVHEVGNKACPGCRDTLDFCECGGLLHNYWVLDEEEGEEFQSSVCDQCYFIDEFFFELPKE